MKTNIKTLNYSFSGAVCAGALLLMTASAHGQNLFVAGDNTGDVYEITPGGVQSTFATGMNYPLGLAFNNAGNLFVANSANNGLGGNITEITPNGTQSIFASGVDPQALAFNSAGNLFEADYNSGNIYEFTPSGIQSTFATGFSFPISMTFNNVGDLFVGSGYGNGNGVITEIMPNGTQSVFASGLNFPQGLAFNSAGNLFESEYYGGGSINEFTPGGAETAFAVVTDPNEMAFNNAGNLFVSTYGGSVIEITPDGSESTFATDSSILTGMAFQPVPEPSVMALSAIGAVTFFVRMRR